MVIFGIAIILGVALLVGLWKGPVKNIVKAMKESGSSTFEAYTVIILLTVGVAFVVYMIAQVL